MKSRAPFFGSKLAPGVRSATGRGFSLVELLVVIAVISILLALTFPVLNRAMAKSRQIQCLNQLRQTGIASQTFAQDHNDRLPVQLWTNGCSVTNHRHEIVVANALVRSSCAFLAMSNELANPQLLACRADKRTPALNFSELRDENVSYLVGLQASLSQPVTILALDGNVINLTSNTPVDPIQGGSYQFAWTQIGHGRKGNVLYADGHVELRKNASVTVAPIPQPTPAPVSPEPGPSDTAADSSGNYDGATGGVAGLAPAPTRSSDSTSPTTTSPSNSQTPTILPTAIETNTRPSRLTNGGIPSTNQIQFQPGTSLSTSARPKPATIPASIEPESLAQPQFEPPVTPSPSSSVGPGGGGGTGKDDFDSDNYRRFVFGVEIIYLLLVLWAVGVVILYVLKYWWVRRRR